MNWLTDELSHWLAWGSGHPWEFVAVWAILRGLIFMLVETPIAMLKSRGWWFRVRIERAVTPARRTR